MNFGYSETCLGHDTGARHPETADRLRALREALATRHGVGYVDADPADRDALCAVHDPEYVDEFEAFCVDGGGRWDQDTVAGDGTLDAALQSAGLAQWAAEAALDGADGRQTPFALVRPPGHHAVTDDAMGFCFVNNAAVAAETAARRDGVDRVAVLDWDVHHGNGTQDVFAGDDDRFYLSIHEEGIYPDTGAADETDGGTVLNAPLPAGAGDADFCHVLSVAALPALDAFDPDLLVVSAGFDAHRHDPISRMRVSTEGYATLTERLRTFAAERDLPLAFVLEGGYALDTLSESVVAVHETFAGRDPVTPDGDPGETTRELVAGLRDRHGLS